MNKPDFTEFGRKVFKLRKAAKLKQIELAEKIDVSRALISMWETGRITELKASNLEKLALYFEKPSSWFIGVNQTSHITPTHGDNFKLSSPSSRLDFFRCSSS